MRQRLLEILVVLASLAAMSLAAWSVTAQTRASEPEVIEVHTGETKSIKWNPETSEATMIELPDGNHALVVRPRAAVE